MLKINGKTFMNIQEAVQWLLDNNALTFQCTANYVANTEIGMGTIVNPSPAKVRIGSLIFFADSKMSTVVGLTENGFIVSDQYNDLVDDLVYVSNVQQDASGHLIVTLSNGDTIDAGLIKQVSSFTINASQHLVVTYNDGSSADLGTLADFSNVDLVAKTLEQNNANYGGENIALLQNSSMTSAGLVLTNIYNRLEVINKVLYVIINVKIENPTASNYSGPCQCDVTTALPQKYAEVIYDLLGKKVSEASDNAYVVIAGHDAVSFSGTDYSNIETGDYFMFLCNRPTPNQVALFLKKTTNMTLNAGTAKYITARMPLTLL